MDHPNQLSPEDAMSSLFQTAAAADSASMRARSDAQTWSDERDEVALGCECANPALQIDRWHQETFQPAIAAAAAE